MARPASQPPARLRQWLLALLAAGLVGLAVELALREHYEDSVMLVPFAAVAVALAAIVLHAVAGTAGTVRVLQGAMAALIVCGAAGVALHYQGSREFQLEMDPTLSRADLFWKVLHMKAPPTLAPGVMVQLGLLGLISTYRHPALDRAGSAAWTGDTT